MKTILLLLILLVLITGCTEDTFKVKYYSSDSSSGGSSSWDISYIVQDGEIVSCEGTHSYPPSFEQTEQGIYENNIEYCDVEKLKTGKYPNVKIITKMPFRRSKESSFGSSSYGWKIIPIDETLLDSNLVFSYSLSSIVCSPCKEIKIYDSLDVTVFENHERELKKIKISSAQLEFIKAEMKKMDFFNAEIETDCSPQGGAETIYFTDGITKRTIISTCNDAYPQSIEDILHSF